MTKKDKVKIGDMLWVKLKGSQNDYGFGEVVEVFSFKKGECLFNFHCLINGGLRMGKARDIIVKPTGRMVGKLSSSQREIKEVLKNK